MPWPTPQKRMGDAARIARRPDGAEPKRRLLHSLRALEDGLDMADGLRCAPAFSTTTSHRIFRHGTDWTFGNATRAVSQPLTPTSPGHLVPARLRRPGPTRFPTCSNHCQVDRSKLHNVPPAAVIPNPSAHSDENHGVALLSTAKARPIATLAQSNLYLGPAGRSFIRPRSIECDSRLRRIRRNERRCLPEMVAAKYPTLEDDSSQLPAKHLVVIPQARGSTGLGRRPTTRKSNPPT